MAKAGGPGAPVSPDRVRPRLRTMAVVALVTVACGGGIPTGPTARPDVPWDLDAIGPGDARLEPGTPRPPDSRPPSDGMSDERPPVGIPADNRPPLAAIQATPVSGEPPLEVAFDAGGSHDPDGRIVAWAWDFGDGAQGEGVRVSHTYGDEGAFTVTLTVTDERGATGATTAWITVSPASTGGPALRRIGHRAVQNAGIVDVPRRPQTWYSVAAYDDGSVVALNTFSGPQLFRFDTATGTLTYRALQGGDELGNEDDLRWRIRAFKGPSAAESFHLWTDKSHQDITGENGGVRRDSAVFVGRPDETTPGRMPLTATRTCNFRDDPDLGPGRAALDVDPDANLVFAPIDRFSNPSQDDVLQVFRLDPSTGALEGRVQVWEPDPGDARQDFSFIRVDPAHRVALFSAGNPWEPDEDVLYLARYEPVAGGVAQVQVARTTDLLVEGAEPLHRLRNARDAAFVEHEGRLVAIVAGGLYDRDAGVPERQSSGLFVFDLGPLDGPYALSRPVARIPFGVPVENVRLFEGRLLLSARGLHAMDPSAVAAARGVVGIAPVESVPLPYPTFEFDGARIGGRSYVFLAAGKWGLDVFHVGDGGHGAAAGPIRDEPRAVALDRGPGQILLETGGGLVHLGAPSMNEAGALAVWAVTDRHREAIVRKVPGKPAEWVALAADGSWTTFGRPSMARDGTVAFWAAAADGRQAILVAGEGGTTEIPAEEGAPDLGNPEIADDHAVLFPVRDLEGRQSLRVGSAGGSFATAFAEGGVSDQIGDYDISPSGVVAYIRVDLQGPDRLTLWSGGTGKTVFQAKEEQDFLRFGTGGYLTLRAWGGEIASLFRVDPSGKATEAAVHRDKYGFGDFVYGAANLRGDIAFLAVRWKKDSSPVAEMGNWLHWYGAAGGDPRPVVTRPQAEVDGARVVDVDFVDAISDQGAIRFTVTLQDGNGRIRQAVVGTGP